MLLWSFKSLWLCQPYTCTNFSFKLVIFFIFDKTLKRTKNIWIWTKNIWIKGWSLHQLACSEKKLIAIWITNFPYPHKFSLVSNEWASAKFIISIFKGLQNHFHITHIYITASKNSKSFNSNKSIYIDITCSFYHILSCLNIINLSLTILALKLK